uniref:Uncharacterized protein n=1 Tax=Anguilla anguilla TaxID=7936 RepID=A0A0E9TC58_ANGAN
MKSVDQSAWLWFSYAPESY